MVHVSWIVACLMGVVVAALLALRRNIARRSEADRVARRSQRRKIRAWFWHNYVTPKQRRLTYYQDDGSA
ncbi:hypothetical protein KZ810_02645 [Sphingomonas sp. RHCKR47]|nr:hypothetical protein [Sphingomonas citricola]